jgi:type II secretory pathway component PulM
VPGLTQDDEEDREYGETHELDRLAAPLVNEEEAGPVSRDQTSGGKNQISNANVVQVIVYSTSTFALSATETDSRQNDTRVQTKTVESNLQNSRSVYVHPHRK